MVASGRPPPGPGVRAIRDKELPLQQPWRRGYASELANGTIADDPVVEVEDAIGAAGLAPPLGRRAGIEEDLAVDAFGVPRDVAVAENDDVGVGEATVHAVCAPGAGTAVVHHADPHALDLEALFDGKRAPEVDVVVAEHRIHRCEAPEVVEYVGSHQVAGME